MLFEPKTSMIVLRALCAVMPQKKHIWPLLNAFVWYVHVLLFVHHEEVEPYHTIYILACTIMVYHFIITRAYFFYKIIICEPTGKMLWWSCDWDHTCLCVCVCHLRLSVARFGHLSHNGRRCSFSCFAPCGRTLSKASGTWSGQGVDRTNPGLWNCWSTSWMAHYPVHALHMDSTSLVKHPACSFVRFLWQFHRCVVIIHSVHTLFLQTIHVETI